MQSRPWLRYTYHNSKLCPPANGVKCGTYKRLKGLDRTQAKIQLIVTKHMPIQAILANFYTTAVVNICRMVQSILLVS